MRKLVCSCNALEFCVEFNPAFNNIWTCGFRCCQDILAEVLVKDPHFLFGLPFDLLEKLLVIGPQIFAPILQLTQKAFVVDHLQLVNELFALIVEVT